MVPAPTPEGGAWDRAQGGLWAEAFVADVKESIADPMIFFSKIAGGRGWVRPWFFATIISVAVFLIALSYQLGFQSLAASAHIGGLFSAVYKPFLVLSVPFAIAAMALFALIGIPIFTTVALIFQTLITHFCLVLLGGARREMEATFRVICFSMGPQLFQVIPLIGGLIAWGWQMVLIIIGLKVVHGTSYARSALAVFLPTLACCGAILLLAATIFGWTFAAIFAGMH